MNKKSAIETAKKINIIYNQGVITDHKVQDWFLKFHSGNTSLRDKLRPGCLSNFNQDDLIELAKCNLCKSP